MLLVLSSASLVLWDLPVKQRRLLSPRTDTMEGDPLYWGGHPLYFRMFSYPWLYPLDEKNSPFPRVVTIKSVSRYG